MFRIIEPLLVDKNLMFKFMQPVDTEFCTIGDMELATTALRGHNTDHKKLYGDGQCAGSLRCRLSSTG